MSELIIYTEAEAAKILRIDEKALRNLRYRHKIGHLKGGYYRPKHLEEFLESREAKCGDSQSSSSARILPIGSSTCPDKETSPKAAIVRARSIMNQQKPSSRITC